MRAMNVPAVLRALLLLGLFAGPSAAAVRWTTLARPYRYLGMLASGDTVWCGTLDTGLLRYLRSSGTFETFSKQPSGLASNRVMALAMDRSGRLWAATQNAGVSRLERDRETWGLLNAFDGLPSDSVSVLRAQGDTLWIGTAGGLALWDGQEVAGRLPDGVNPSPFADNHITGLAVRGDTLWVGTPVGVYVSRLSTGLSLWGTASAGLPGPVAALAASGTDLFALAYQTTFRWDDAGARWQELADIGSVARLGDSRGVAIAASSQGIYRWSGTDWAVVNGGLQSDVSCPLKDPICPGLFAAALDDSGRFVAANGSGIFLAGQPGQAWTTAVPPGPPSNDVVNVELDGDWTYVSCFATGVGRYDGNAWRIWDTSPCGTCDTTLAAPGYVFALMRDKRGYKWAGAWTNSLDYFDDHQDPPVVEHKWWHAPDDSMRHTWAWASANDSSGSVWFGMDTPLLGEPCCPAIGLERYDVATGGYVRNYGPDNSGIEKGKIHGLTVDSTGVVWVGYSPGGIVHFRPSRTSTDLLVSAVVKGSSGLDIQGLVARGDDIWVLTTGAVLRLKRTNPDVTTAEEYPIPNSPNQIAARPLDVGPDGSVWVGTEGGVRVFRPDGTSEDFTTLDSPLVNDIVRAVRVDQRTGAVWIGTAGGLTRYEPSYVPPPQPPLPSLEVKVYPNPALLNGAGLTLRLAGNATDYRGAVYDAGGRRLHRFDGGNGQVFWDGRDASGSLVHPGVYFVRVEAGGHARTVRVALLR